MGMEFGRVLGEVGEGILVVENRQVVVVVEYCADEEEAVVEDW